MRADLEGFAAAPDIVATSRDRTTCRPTCALFTQVELTVPVQDGHCALGTWQGMFLWEHRLGPRAREVGITVWGH